MILSPLWRLLCWLAILVAYLPKAERAASLLPSACFALHHYRTVIAWGSAAVLYATASKNASAARQATHIQRKREKHSIQIEPIYPAAESASSVSRAPQPCDLFITLISAFGGMLPSAYTRNQPRLECVCNLPVVWDKQVVYAALALRFYLTRSDLEVLIDRKHTDRYPNMMDLVYIIYSYGLVL